MSSGIRVNSNQSISFPALTGHNLLLERLVIGGAGREWNLSLRDSNGVEFVSINPQKSGSQLLMIEVPTSCTVVATGFEPGDALLVYSQKKNPLSPALRVPLRRRPCGRPGPLLLDEETIQDIKVTFREVLSNTAGTAFYKAFDPSTTQSVYSEAVEKVFKPSVEIAAEADLNPSSKTYTQFGVQDRLDAVFKIAALDVESLNLSLSTDDRIVFNGREYSIMRVAPGKVLQNSPVSYSIAGMIVSSRSGLDQP